MICIAKENQLEDIKSLWKECFPGEEDFFNYFFENVFKIENTLVYKKDCEIVAMTQMIPFESNLGLVTYIYGACTAVKHRKQGYMDKLLNKSFEISKENGHKFSILIPAEEWLFDFYAKFSYKGQLNFDEFEFKPCGKSDVCIFELEYSDIDIINELYSKNMNEKFYIKRNYEYFSHQIDLFKCGAVKYMKNDEIIGYSFGYIENDILNISEIISTDINECLNSHRNKKIIYKTIGGSKKLGCIKSLCDEIEPNGYINLMYN